MPSALKDYKMSTNKVFQITSVLAKSSIIVAMEHEGNSTEELELKFGTEVTGDVEYTVDKALQAHLDDLKGTPTSNLSIYHETLITIEDNVIKLLSTAPATDDRSNRPQSCSSDAPMMDTY